MQQPDVQNVKRASEIYAKYGDFIWRTIRSKVNDVDLADDLYQSFFLSLVSRSSLDNIRSIEGYLYKATMNHIVDWVRQAERRQASAEKFMAHCNSIANKTGARNDISIEEEQESELVAFIRRQLPVRQSEAITLRFVDGCKTQEVAEEMNVKKGTASTYISAGLKKIRRLAKLTEWLS